ncbi:MAG: hypothetical protein LBC20_02660 [Planctomycetaceae bacterium]|jgi:hypothetical protein|nr:hypothetical protein [Planctomycetaceae bacterium]
MSTEELENFETVEDENNLNVAPNVITDNKNKIKIVEVDHFELGKKKPIKLSELTAIKTFKKIWKST